jgi:hypothetical protein
MSPRPEVPAPSDCAFARATQSAFTRGIQRESNEFEWAKKANRGNVKVRIDAPYLRVYPPPQVDFAFCP